MWSQPRLIPRHSVSRQATPSSRVLSAGKISPPSGRNSSKGRSKSAFPDLFSQRPEALNDPGPESGQNALKTYKHKRPNTGRPRSFLVRSRNLFTDFRRRISSEPKHLHAWAMSPRPVSPNLPMLLPPKPSCQPLCGPA